MNLTPIYANTLIPRLPKLINDNFNAVKDYIDFFYDGSNNIIVKPINTTGRVKATTGQFVNVLVDNLTVKKQFTNMYENVTTSDIDFVTVYNGEDTSTRLATDSSLWPYEDPNYVWFDATQPYYKINNEEPIAIQNEDLGKVVRLIFDPTNIVNNFQILLDPCSNSVFEVGASDSSALYLELITVDYDVSYGPTWIPYKYGRLDASFGGGGGGGGVGPGTEYYIPRFYTSTTVGDSNLFLSGTTLNTNDISVNGQVTTSSNIKTKDIIINETIKDLDGNSLISYDGSTLQINKPGISRDVSIYGFTNFANNVNIDGSLYVDGSLFIGSGGGTSVTEFDPTVDDSITMDEAVGGLTAGTTAGSLRGQSYDKLLTDILFPTVYPNLTDPYVQSFSTPSLDSLELVGASTPVSFTTQFNQGTIDPPYGTSGLRSGLPNTYTYTGTGISGSYSNTSNTDYRNIPAYTVTIGYQNWTAVVSYDEGTQPFDNKGNPYDASLAAGDTSTNGNITIEGVYPLFATSSSISDPNTQQTLKSMKTANNVQISLVTQPSASPVQSFDIPDEWLGAPTYRSLTNVLTYSTLSGNWESTGLGQWTTSPVTHIVEGNTINYTRYSYNLGARGEVQIRLVF